MTDIIGGDLVKVFAVMKRDEIGRYTEAVDDPTTRDVTDREVKEHFLDLSSRSAGTVSTSSSRSASTAVAADDRCRLLSLGVAGGIFWA